VKHKKTLYGKKYTGHSIKGKNSLLRMDIPCQIKVNIATIKHVVDVINKGKLYRLDIIEKKSLSSWIH